MEIELKNGQGVATLRRCVPEEASKIFALQNEVLAAMPHPEYFAPDTLEEIQGFLSDGIVIGAWQGEKIGACFVLHTCGTDLHNYAAFMGVPEQEWPQWGNASSAVVCEQWRGNGLQRKMFEAALPFLPSDIHHLGATVCPDNSFSLNNALKCGFKVVCRREMYGGYDRYLLAKHLD